MAERASNQRWRAFPRRHDGPIVIGLVNNMPDAALKSTERQFRELLADAGGRRPPRVRVFSLPGLARSEIGRQYVRDNHEDIAELWDAELDALIVTGTEPNAADLVDEPYWPMLTEIVDWAAENVTASIWSCLGAHAAVRHLDGIERRSRTAKLSGVFDCIKIADHPLLGPGPTRWRTPHSRYNELPEAELAANGYQILSHSDDAGADVFIKRAKALFVFLQGHPEYDTGALMREYRRDVGRYLAGDRDTYPDMPSGYFDPVITETALEFRERAMRERDPDLLPGFQMLLAQQNLTDSWRPGALRLFSNFLSYLAEERSRRAGWSGVHRSATRRARSEIAYA